MSDKLYISLFYSTYHDRYISERFLPDKAIDLVDEAAARLKIEVTSKPQELDELDRRIIQLQMGMNNIVSNVSVPFLTNDFLILFSSYCFYFIVGVINPAERLSLARDEKEQSPRIVSLDKQITGLQREQQDLTARWELERAGVSRLQDLKNQIDLKMTQIAKAEREYDLNTAAVLKYGDLPALQKELLKEEELYAKKGASGVDEENRMVRDTVGDDDIAGIVSTWTGIPVSKLLEGEMQKLLKLQDELDKRVVGQREATKVLYAYAERNERITL